MRWIGAEHLWLDIGADVRADGVVLGLADTSPFRIRYRLRCDGGWRVREAVLETLDPDAKRLELASDGAGNWADDAGRPLPQFASCVDVDVAATPFTNTLPIRRLGLQPGEAREIDVVYVSIPSLELSRARQRYQCLTQAGGGALYLYESVGSGFRAKLAVDREGLVVTYQGLWERT